MASKFVAGCATFAVSASVGASLACLYVFYKDYKLEQEEGIRSDEVEALNQDLVALTQRLIVLENRKKAETTKIGE